MPRKQYSDDMLDLYRANLLEQLNRIETNVVEVKMEVKKTNGRVSELESRADEHDIADERRFGGLDTQQAVVNSNLSVIKWVGMVVGGAILTAVTALVFK